MAISQFEPYREQIAAWKSQGMQKSEMLRQLHEMYPDQNLAKKHSTFYPFVDSVQVAQPD
jgi:hypothetical protein